MVFSKKSWYDFLLDNHLFFRYCGRLPVTIPLPNFGNNFTRSWSLHISYSQDVKFAFVQIEYYPFTTNCTNQSVQFSHVSCSNFYDRIGQKYTSLFVNFIYFSTTYSSNLSNLQAANIYINEDKILGCLRRMNKKSIA